MSKDVTLETEVTIPKHKYILLARVSVWIIFGIILLVYWFFAWVTQEFIYSDSLYYRSYSGTLTNKTVEEMLGAQSRFWWTGYAFSPILLLLKFLFASTCFSIGVLFSKGELEFRVIFKAAMLTEVVFIIAQVVFITILFINLDDVTLQNATGYFPLSALSLIGIENVHAQWVIYPLQTLNLFEVFYMVAIAWLLSRTTKQSFADIFSIVLPSYGIGLLLWITFVAFLTFQLT
tara:strand:+ start:2437 stop:3135 length:699 start_codon:yes stop_codon:yes gene_type:complete